MAGLITLLVFLLLGQALRLMFNLPMPAAILGMVSLLVFLLVRRAIKPNSSHAPESLAKLSTALAPFLTLFLVPVSVGIMSQADVIQRYGWQLMVILAISLVPGILVTAFVMRGIKS